MCFMIFIEEDTTLIDLYTYLPPSWEYNTTIKKKAPTKEEKFLLISTNNIMSKT